MSTITGDNIHKFRFLALKGALKLEIMGMKKRGRSAYSILKSEYGFSGSKKNVLKQMEEELNAD